jgi:glycosyltransferase involved in cell wall biosynthesis
MNKRKIIKVLLLAGPFEVRGSSSYTLRLAKHLEEHNVTTAVVTPNANCIDATRRRKLPITVYPHMETPIWGNIVMKAMVADLQTDPPALIHVQSRRMLSSGMWLAKRLNCPLILTMHDEPAERERLAIDSAWCRRVIAVSHYVKDRIIDQFNIDPSIVSVIHPGVEPSIKSLGPPVLDPAHVPVVGTAGPLEAVKGIPILLKAARRVQASHPSVQFVIAGAGPEENRLRRLAEELGVSAHVTFIPNMHDFTASLSAMDIFCLPSLQQGLGAIMMEGMAMGKPVIASNVGGVYSVVSDGETGLLVPPSDSRRLAERIQELLNDPVAARAIGEAGRQLIRDNFNVETMVERTVDLYHQVLRSSPSSQAPVSRKKVTSTNAG